MYELHRYEGMAYNKWGPRVGMHFYSDYRRKNRQEPNGFVHAMSWEEKHITIKYSCGTKQQISFELLDLACKWSGTFQKWVFG